MVAVSVGSIETTITLLKADRLLTTEMTAVTAYLIPHRNRCRCILDQGITAPRPSYDTAIPPHSWAIRMLIAHEINGASHHK